MSESGPSPHRAVVRSYNNRLAAVGSPLRWRITASGEMRLTSLRPIHGADMASNNTHKGAE